MQFKWGNVTEKNDLQHELLPVHILIGHMSKNICLPESSCQPQVLFYSSSDVEDYRTKVFTLLAGIRTGITELYARGLQFYKATD
ncbi:UNVERIFIED_CONTAM: hypothetical protein FKN15_033652 [Acipenser sinensis]